MESLPALQPQHGRPPGDGARLPLPGLRLHEAQGQPVHEPHVQVPAPSGSAGMRLRYAVPLAVVIVLLIWQLYAAMSIAIMATL